MNPDDPITLSNYGNHCMAANNWEQAKKLYDQALKIDPTKKTGLRNYSALKAMMTYSSFSADSERNKTNLQAYPDEPQFLFASAIESHEAGEWTKAMQLYQRCIAVCDNEDVHVVQSKKTNGSIRLQSLHAQSPLLITMPPKTRVILRSEGHPQDGIDGTIIKHIAKKNGMIAHS